MASDNNSESRYLEFRPLTPEDEPRSLRNYVSSAFGFLSRRSNDANKQKSEEHQLISPPSSQENVSGFEKTFSRNEEKVHTKIFNLLDLHEKNEPIDTSILRTNWVPDEECNKCSECNEKFTFTKRKHHCRLCGLIYCWRCSDYWIDTQYIHCREKLRLCLKCHTDFINLARARLSDTTIAEDYDFDSHIENSASVLRTPRESQSGRSFAEANYVTPRNLDFDELPYAFYEAQQEEISSEMKLLLQDTNQLQNLYVLIFWGPNKLALQTYKHKLNTYSDTFTGKQLVQWLINNDKASSRQCGTAIGQALLDAEYIVPIPKKGKLFLENQSVYQTSLDRDSVNHRKLELSTDEPIWVKDIPFEIDESSGYDHEKLSGSMGLQLDFNLENHIVSVRKDKAIRSSSDGENFTEVSAALTATVPMAEQDTAVDGLMSAEALSALRIQTPQEDRSGASSPNQERNSAKDLDSLTQRNLELMSQQHEEKLLRQLMTQEDLPELWFPIIHSTARTIVQVIRPDTKDDSDNMDIRSYIHFKKISGVNQRQCLVVNGTVFSKNVLHRSMKTNLVDPAILLVGSSIDFQSSTKDNYISMDAIRSEEDKVVANLVQKVKSYEPNIVLVEDRVANKATEQLMEANITLVVGVKNSVMKRVARCTQAEIVENIQSQTAKPILGLCHSFYTHSHTTSDNKSKTLMYFDGCPMHSGCTLILKGPVSGELEKVKEIMYFIIFAMYNSKLERNFLMKESAFTSPSFLKHCGFPDLAKDTENDECMSMFLPSRLIAAGPSPYQCISDASDQSSEETEATETPEDPLQNMDAPPSLASGSEGINDGRLFSSKLSNTLLSVSPYYRFKEPYLMSESGSKSANAQFLQQKAYYSQLFEEKMIRTEQTWSDSVSSGPKISRLPLHEFVTTPKVLKADTALMKTQLANFRAKGSTILPVYDEKTDRNLLYEYINFEGHSKGRTKPVYHQMVLTQNKQLDSLHIMNHQRLPVMFCSFSVTHPTSSFCAGPDTLVMNFYGDNDICLGDFLEKYCFDTDYRCPSKCLQPAITHKRRFAHGDGCIEVILQNVPDNAFRNPNISFWTWCRRCRKLSSVVPLSSEMWSLSFAKYIEMRLYEKRMTRRNNDPCDHSIHQDHHHYFIKGSLIVVFKYIVERARELILPPFHISYHPDPQVYKDTIQLAGTLHSCGVEVFNGMLARLSRVSFDSKWEYLLKDLLASESQQRILFKEKLDSIQEKLDSPYIDQAGVSYSMQFADVTHKEKACSILCDIKDQISTVSIGILNVINEWNSTVQEITSSKKKDEKTDKAKTTPQRQQSNPSSTTQTASGKNASEDSAMTHTQSNPLGDNEKTTQVYDDSDSVAKIHPEILASDKSQLYAQEVGKFLEKAPDRAPEVDVVDAPVPEKKPNPVRQMISNLRNPSSDLFIKSPFSLEHHIGMLKEVRIPVVIIDEQPSTIIAHALASEIYQQELIEIQRNMNSVRPDGISFSQIVEPVQNNHVELHFEDHTSNFYCKIFYAEQFRHLRSLVFPRGEDWYIRSLSTCVNWKAKGGKSGSSFCKTGDDRFVLKQMSQPEEDSFTKFGVKYINYILDCEKRKKPTCLTKIVGFYYIAWKNSSTGKEKKLTFLIMENLFYKRDISFKFDLKGSLRNRLVSLSGKQDGETVLLDENLQKMLPTSPLYLKSHCKKVITEALESDSAFLAAQLVMDYSLLIGIDDINNELVVGIIDYLRTFTWDKKLETMVKSTVLMAGATRTKPTVVSPRVYRTRFCEAMDRYFVIMPDRWFAFGMSSLAAIYKSL